MFSMSLRSYRDMADSDMLRQYESMIDHLIRCFKVSTARSGYAKLIERLARLISALDKSNSIILTT